VGDGDGNGWLSGDGGPGDAGVGELMMFALATDVMNCDVPVLGEWWPCSGDL